MRYFLYARKSMDREDRQVLSIESQLHELRLFAKKEGLEIVEELTESRTAKEPGREVFSYMLEKIEDDVAQGILAWHPDRLARNSVDGGKIIYLVDTGEIKDLKFPTYRFDNTAYGKFVLTIAFGQSKYYVDNLSENVKRGIKQKLRKGEWPGCAPIGYLNDLKNHTIVKDPEKSLLVKKAFQLYSTGDYTLQSISDKLHRLGLVGKRGKKVSRRTIELILKNPFYYGVFKYKGELYEGSHPPLISKGLFDKVQAVFDGKYKGYSPKPKLFPFRGFIRCGECGCMITAQIQKGHHYYHCTKRKTECSQRYIREENLARQISEAVMRVFIDDETKDKMFRELDGLASKEELSNFSIKRELKKKMKELDGRLERLLDLHLSDLINADEYTLKKKKILQEKMEIKEKLENLNKRGMSRFELAKDFITTCNQARYIAWQTNFGRYAKIS